MKIKYIPGNYPSILMAYETVPNLGVFNEMLTSMNIPLHINFLEGSQYRHYWNQNVYFIIDDNTKFIDIMLFLDFVQVVYMLRIINEELSFEVSEEVFAQLKPSIDQYFSDEFKY